MRILSLETTIWTLQAETMGKGPVGQSVGVVLEIFAMGSKPFLLGGDFQ